MPLDQTNWKLSDDKQVLLHLPTLKYMAKLLDVFNTGGNDPDYVVDVWKDAWEYWDEETQGERPTNYDEWINKIDAASQEFTRLLYNA